MGKSCYNGSEPPDDNVKQGWKPLVDMTKGSSDLGDAVAKLPKGHNWGKVRINENAGRAECIKCGLTVGYNWDKKWISFSVFNDDNGLIPKNCKEVLMDNALK